MKKVLVLGGAGFVGTNLIKYLNLKKNIKKIVSLDDYSSGTKKNHIKSNKVIYLRGNTININKNSILKKNKFDTIFHFAEFSRIAESFKNYDKCWKNNTIGTYEVIKFSLKHKSKLVYSASSSTIGKNKKHLSPYAWTKYTSCELIKNFSKWFNLKYTILYFYCVYGPHHIKTGSMATVIGIFEDQYLKRKPLTVDKPGTQKRDFTHINDIIDGTYSAAIKTNNLEFHLGSGKEYSIIQVAKMFKTKILIKKEKPGERFEGLCDYSNAKKILGYNPKHDLKKYINNFINSVE